MGVASLKKRGKPLFSTSLFKKSSAITIDKNVLFKKIILLSIGKSDFKNFWFS